MSLKGINCLVDQLSVEEKNQMFFLMDQHYENCKKEIFISDLNQKTGVLLLQDKNNMVQGFSTYLIQDYFFKNQKITILFSGDTIVNKDHWGQMALFYSSGSLLNQLLEENQNPIYWFLITKGFRTYLFLPLYFQKFYPHYKNPTPDYEKSLLESLGKDFFGESFQKKKGILYFDPPKEFLKSDFAEVASERKKNLHVQFFLQKNPGYLRGNELLCLARISPENFTRASRKFTGRR